MIPRGYDVAPLTFEHGEGIWQNRRVVRVGREGRAVELIG
jgi:hypothetical protein